VEAENLAATIRTKISKNTESMFIDFKGRTA
jgi:hypothetical protein